VSAARAYDDVNFLWRGGSVTGDVTAGAGMGSLAADVDITGDVAVAGPLGRIMAGANLRHCTIGVTGGGLGSVRVGGNLDGARIEVGGLFRNFFVAGNFLGGNVDATSLGRVTVEGLIIENAGDGEDVIRARQGTFFIRDVSWSGRIEDGAGHEFEGLLAHISP